MCTITIKEKFIFASLFFSTCIFFSLKKKIFHFDLSLDMCVYVSCGYEISLEKERPVRIGAEEERKKFL